MKKVLILIATIVLICSSLTLTAFADGTSSVGPKPIDPNNLAGEAENIANRWEQLTDGTNLAGGLANSKLVQGTRKLVADAQAILIGLSIVIGGAFITYFLIRKGMADEHDQIQWRKKITGAIICTVGAVLASTVLPIIVGYYQ